MGCGVGVGVAGWRYPRLEKDPLSVSGGGGGH